MEVQEGQEPQLAATKSCSRCRAIKSLADFFNSKSTKSGKDHYCKLCRRAHADGHPNARLYRQRAQANYYQRNKEKVNAKTWAWAKAHPESRARTTAAWRAKNAEKVKADQRLRSIAWREANREKVRASIKRYRERNKDKVRAWRRTYGDGRVISRPKWANSFFMEEAYHLAKLRTKLTGYRWVVDHIVPLKSHLVCGLHTHTNLQVIPAVVNAAKSNIRWPDMPGA